MLEFFEYLLPTDSRSAFRPKQSFTDIVDRPLLFVELIFILFSAFGAFAVVYILGSNYIAAGISLGGMISLAVVLVLFKSGQNYEMCARSGVIVGITVVALQHAISGLHSSLNLIWVPILVGFSVILLDRRQGTYFFYYTAVFCGFAEVNRNFYHYFTVDVGAQGLFLANTFGIFIGGGLSYFAIRLLVAKHERLVSNQTRRIAELHDQSETNSALLSVVAHDISTPLSVVLGYSKSIRNLNLSADAERENLKVISGAQKMANIVRNVKEMQSAGSGKQQITLTSTDLTVCVSEAIESLSDLIAVKSVRVIVRNEGNPGPVLVLADPISLTHNVIQNILSNAIKFSPEDSVVEVTIRQTVIGGVELRIRDNGVGIPSDLLPYIFDPTHPTTRPDTSGLKGTGFGLPICKVFMTRYGGSIDAISETAPQGDHRGTVFTLRFRASCRETASGFADRFVSKTTT